eukprot:TRINITY_DN27630_c0_g1_i1.p1 TRINITY_DN27630_c0_g1~~TRINITY_DN27630_c0_g1_i1.p1  ORF type:complete len:993 (+),score=130.73 TRINITY_DN27630_c0_g1_i1:108-3086(+)
MGCGAQGRYKVTETSAPLAEPAEPLALPDKSQREDAQHPPATRIRASGGRCSIAEAFGGPVVCICTDPECEELGNALAGEFERRCRASERLFDPGARNDYEALASVVPVGQRTHAGRSGADAAPTKVLPCEVLVPLLTPEWLRSADSIAMLRSILRLRGLGLGPEMLPLVHADTFAERGPDGLTKALGAAVGTLLREATKPGSWGMLDAASVGTATGVSGGLTGAVSAAAAWLVGRAEVIIAGPQKPSAVGSTASRAPERAQNVSWRKKLAPSLSQPPKQNPTPATSIPEAAKTGFSFVDPSVSHGSGFFSPPRGVPRLRLDTMGSGAMTDDVKDVNPKWSGLPGDTMSSFVSSTEGAFSKRSMLTGTQWGAAQPRRAAWGDSSHVLPGTAASDSGTSSTNQRGKLDFWQHHERLSLIEEVELGDGPFNQEDGKTASHIAEELLRQSRQFFQQNKDDLKIAGSASAPASPRDRTDVSGFGLDTFEGFNAQGRKTFNKSDAFSSLLSPLSSRGFNNHNQTKTSWSTTSQWWGAHPAETRASWASQCIPEHEEEKYEDAQPEFGGARCSFMQNSFQSSFMNSKRFDAKVAVPAGMPPLPPGAAPLQRTTAGGFYEPSAGLTGLRWPQPSLGPQERIVEGEFGRFALGVALIPTEAGGFWGPKFIATDTNLDRRVVLWRFGAPPSVAAEDSARLALCTTAVFLHQQGVVHGALRGANVLLGPGAAVRLADFGLSSLRARESLHLRSLRSSNLPSTEIKQRSAGRAWLAPELLEGGCVTQAGDVWAFGCVTVEITVGAPPGEGVETRALRAVDARALPLLPEERSRLPAEAMSLVRSCLRFSPDQRPAAADVFAAGRWGFEEPADVTWLPDDFCVDTDAEDDGIFDVDFEGRGGRARTRSNGSDPDVVIPFGASPKGTAAVGSPAVSAVGPSVQRSGGTSPLTIATPPEVKRGPLGDAAASLAARASAGAGATGSGVSPTGGFVNGTMRAAGSRRR